MPRPQVSQPGKLWQGTATSARLANAPSVLCNVAAGLIFGGAQLSDPAAVLGLLAALALYHGGCFLNDWFDRGWDAIHRPNRPLPSGLIRPRRYWILAVVLLCAGCLSAFLADPNAGIVALVIAGLVILYTVIHKRSAWSVLPMGLCRALLPAMGLAAAGGNPFEAIAILSGLGLLLHVAGISWLARTESIHAHGRRSRLFSACFAAAALTPIAGGVLLLD
ncbi:MAG: UbiA family prenyltransferase, partial [Luteolibacter sp.]